MIVKSEFVEKISEILSLYDLSFKDQEDSTIAEKLEDRLNVVTECMLDHKRVIKEWFYVAGEFPCSYETLDDEVIELEDVEDLYEYVQKENKR